MGGPCFFVGGTSIPLSIWFTLNMIFFFFFFFFLGGGGGGGGRGDGAPGILG